MGFQKKPHPAMIHNETSYYVRQIEIWQFHKTLCGCQQDWYVQGGWDWEQNLKISFYEIRGQNSSVPEFKEIELMEALKHMRPKYGAPGPDDISPPFLKNFGPNTIKLLRKFNISLTTGNIPQVWRNANIISFLKANKPHSDLRSFRPAILKLGKIYPWG